MRVIITGGTGIIGTSLAASLAGDGHEVISLSRSPQKHQGSLPKGVRVVGWDGRTAKGWGELADGAGAIVNLAGDNLSSGRWTPEKKERIRSSRVQPGQAVVEAVRQANVKPKVVVQVSGTNYYGVEEQGPITEDCPPGDDFLARICIDWENATAPVEAMGVRRVIARTAPVLTRKGGALPKMAMPYQFFVGGPLGSGRQWFPWVHIADVIGAYHFFIENPDILGAFNLTSPQPLTNREFGKVLAGVLRRPNLIPVPSFVLKLLFGEMSTVVLDGNQVIPKRLLEAGYKFKFPDARSALENIYREGERS